MNIENENLQCSLHVVIVPFPAPSHVNAVMNLAQLLAMRRCFITFVNTEWIQNRMVGVCAKNANSLISIVSRGDQPDHWGKKIRFLSVPDGLPPDHGRTSKFDEYLPAIQKLGPPLEHLLRSGSNPTADVDKYSFPPITCIVTDSFMSCTEEVAANMKVPRVIFWPFCAAASIAECHTSFLISHGHIPVTSKRLSTGMLLFDFFAFQQF